MSQDIDPTMFLSVADLDGTPLETPYFAALQVRYGLVSRLRRLAQLCETQEIAWLAFRERESNVYWHASDEALTEQTSTFHVVGTAAYIELSARRRVAGGYGRLEVIGQTPVFDVAELTHMLKQRIVLDFREHEGQDVDGEPFALEVIRRLRAVGIWPQADRQRQPENAP